MRAPYPWEGSGVGSCFGSLSWFPDPPFSSLPQSEFRECDYNKFMSVLDTNKDLEVDFGEYVRSLASLCLYCHEYFKECPPEPPCPQ